MNEDERAVYEALTAAADALGAAARTASERAPGLAAGLAVAWLDVQRMMEDYYYAAVSAITY